LSATKFHTRIKQQAKWRNATQPVKERQNGYERAQKKKKRKLATGVKRQA